MSYKLFIPIQSFTLGAVTGLWFRDELNMPIYLKIKVALIEHRILSRQKLTSDLLSVVDAEHGKEKLVDEANRVRDEHEQ